jgi:hypothetical protein
VAWPRAVSGTARAQEARFASEYNDPVISDPGRRFTSELMLN